MGNILSWWDFNDGAGHRIKNVRYLPWYFVCSAVEDFFMTSMLSTPSKIVTIRAGAQALPQDVISYILVAAILKLAANMCLSRQYVNGISF